MSDDKQMDVLDYLSQDKVFDFLTKYKKLEEEFKAMKKTYDKRIKKPIKELAGTDPMKVANDIFQVTITKTSVTESVIPINKIKKLSKKIQNMVLSEETIVVDKVMSMSDIRKLPQKIQDQLIVESRPTPRMILKFIADEKDGGW